MSGGLDSTTLAYRAISEGYVIQPINIFYGQKNAVEMQAFENLKNKMKAEFPDNFLEPMIVDLTAVMKSSIELWGKERDRGGVKAATDMEFYTPSRNLLFTTIAAMVGEISAMASGKTEVAIGLGIHKHTQYDRDYWDITPEFVERMNRVFELNDCMQVSMFAPYVDNTKDEIVKDAIKLGVPYKETWTCYNPVQKIKDFFGSSVIQYKPCLKCEACVERRAAGEKAGATDINSYSLNVKY